MSTTIEVLLIGIGATAFIDLWALARRCSFGTRLPDYGLLGRWLASMARGRFVHDATSRARPVRGEAAIGWIAHYAIGVAFAAALPMCAGLAWLEEPTIAPALLVGIATVAAPFLILQPAMGAGIAASRTPRPGSARMQSLVNHCFFGLGLFLSATAIQFIITGD